MVSNRQKLHLKEDIGSKGVESGDLCKEIDCIQCIKVELIWARRLESHYRVTSDRVLYTALRTSVNEKGFPNKGIFS